MARTFRYRYVDFGTSFTGDQRNRGPESGDETPGTLFANALVTDVGGTCWGPNEPLSVIDHHFLRDSQFPSASAAVLHKAAQIRERFGGQDLVWLVTHKEPDFDAFCSMYLARWIIEEPSVTSDWRQLGLEPDGWVDSAEGKKFDWFHFDVSAVPIEHRWAFLLASYASLLESRHRISCPRQRALRSVLFAAVKRGRDYMSETSGATEFFDEVRSILQKRQLNPTFDSVLDGSSLFEPELTMLDREAEAYLRDIQRARRSTVYLPESEAPSPDFFKNHRDFAHQDHRRGTSDLDAEHLLLSDTFRIPTDGIYLRDPECLLFKEWARVDLDNSSLGAGIEFTAIAYSAGRPEALSNKTDYQFSIDPERANGRHLYTLWSRLQTQEVECLRAQQQEIVAAPPQRGLQHGTTTLGSLLADPWVGGQSRFGNEVSTPLRGTLLGPAGTRSDLRDDPVAEAVRTELEGSIYSAVSLVTGPQVRIIDFAGSRDGVDIAPEQYDLNSPLEIPPPPETYFRFAHVRLRSDVPIAAPNLAKQIGETLWQVLYPEVPGTTPSDFSERHLLVNANCVGVWGDRGIAVAQKQDFAGGASTPEHQASELRADFAEIVSMTRDLDRLTARWARVSTGLPGNSDTSPSALRTLDVDGFQSIIAAGEELARRAAHIKHTLTMPDRDLLRRFYDALELDGLIATLQNITRSASEHLRQHELALQAGRTESRVNAVGRVQCKLDWLEVFTVALVAIGVIGVMTGHVNPGYPFEKILLSLGGPLVLAFTAWALKPWRKKNVSAEGKLDRHAWILIAVAIACVTAWLAGLAQLWTAR